MSEKTMTFNLTRPAAHRGGDRYEYGTKGDNEHIIFYIPQSISRSEGEVKKRLKITITDN